MKSFKILSALHNKKSLRLGLLFLSTLFVMTASAAVYYGLQYRSVSTISKTTVAFCGGCAADFTTAGGTLGTNNTYVKLTSIKGYPNATGTYEQSVGIQNSDTSAHNVRLRANLQSGTSTAYNTIVFRIVDASNNVQGTAMTITGGGSFTVSGSPTTFVSLAASTTWYVRVEVTGAASNTITASTATIDLYIDVQ
ncbi:hypothetical protein AUG19_06445 [archaeon 13_1_20CM_2_54_9]|nr:MAG: hypothetical protein AUJ07_07280 [Crenarchaeota archaeon 13_1_40CM_3_53_5]OLE75195.1 MAG: hypothetical protein AUG19_06445 [archaeon 13_1_20CM_2_54_9]TMI27042.1 MAG: hypothetical protein E6H36_04090 [Candidatus Bathyarchaeota archaeon]TMI30808.1 MAG: hypothetical protein E6H29_07225 [Candidatus Bathyarchaeota archaeon]